MSNSITVTLFTGVGFLAIVVSLAARRNQAARITWGATLLAALGGFFIYGYGFSRQISFLPLAVIRAILASLGMFLGRSDFSAVSGTPLFLAPGGQFLFWLAHFLALYATASAALTTIGVGVLRRLRLLLAGRGNLLLICGINGDSVAFGERLAAADRKNPPVFLDASPDPGLEKAVFAMGGLSFGGWSAGCPDKKLLRSLGIRPGRRRLTVYAMEKDAGENLRCAEGLLAALQERGIRPAQTGLVLLGPEEAGSRLLAPPGGAGYGSVSVYEEATLAARLLTRKYPPWETLSFGPDGRATEDFEALVIGFGQVGQAVLKALVMNGQFEGSRFSLTVFAPDCLQVSGSLLTACRAIPNQYRVDFRACDARSEEMYRFLSQRRDRLKYIVVAVGDPKLGQEIAGELTQFLRGRGIGCPVYQCSARGVRFQQGPETPPVETPLYTPEILSFGELDRAAMALNQRYCQGNGLSPRENWERCDYFSRASSRASADFIPALRYAAGLSGEDPPRGWRPAPELLETLSRTEHLRWCAFHFAAGYETMPPEEFALRCRRYREGEKLRPAKDAERRLHACLIPWEELDALSAEENRATGGRVDYKDLDRRNVLEALGLEEEA